MSDSKQIVKNPSKNKLFTFIFYFIVFLATCFVIAAFVEYGHYVSDFFVNWFMSLPSFFKTFFKVSGVGLLILTLYGLLVFSIWVIYEF